MYHQQKVTFCNNAREALNLNTLLSSQGGAAAEEYLRTQGSSHGMMSAICQFWWSGPLRVWFHKATRGQWDSGGGFSACHLTFPRDSQEATLLPHINIPAVSRPAGTLVTVQGQEHVWSMRGPAEGSLDEKYGCDCGAIFKKTDRKKVFLRFWILFLWGLRTRQEAVMQYILVFGTFESNRSVKRVLACNYSSHISDLKLETIFHWSTSIEFLSDIIFLIEFSIKNKNQPVTSYLNLHMLV